jgi:cytochrome d ubiquinol oxidase subunit II
VPHIYQIVQQRPILIFVVAVTVLLVLNVPREFNAEREFLAFLSSCGAMVGMMAIFGISHFPYMVLSMPNPENSLTIYNAASSQKTLGIMLIIAIMGIPLVLAYTASIYWIFRGKTKIERHSY